MLTSNTTKLLKIVLLLCLVSSASALPTRQVGSTKITGKDELYDADVVAEDGFNKLLVKATTVPELGELFQEHLTNGGGRSLNVDGSVTPVEFKLLAHPTKDKIVQACLIYFIDNGIKLEKFLGLNTSLTNGVGFSITSASVTATFFPIKSTVDINNHFSSEPFQIVVQSGGDYVAGRFNPDTPFIVKAGTADSVKLTVNDNLTTVTEGEIVCNGTFQ